MNGKHLSVISVNKDDFFNWVQATNLSSIYQQTTPHKNIFSMHFVYGYDFLKNLRQPTWNK